MQPPYDMYISSINARQKQAITEAITHFISNKNAQQALGWAWDRIAADCVTGSNFDQLHRPANVCLSRLTRHPEFQKIRAALSIPRNAAFLVDKTGRLYYSYVNVNSLDHVSTVYFSPRDITANVVGIAHLDKELGLLADMTKLTGGWITSGDKMTVGQWLRFHGLSLPDDEEAARALLDLFNFASLPDGTKYGNYWQLLDAPDNSPFKLTEHNRAIIRQVTEDLTGGETSLVASFGIHLILESTSADQLPTSQSYRLQRLIEIAVWASAQGQAYLEALGWFTDESGPKPPPGFVEQLLIAAMLLDLDPGADSANTTFAGFDLYSAHYLTRHPSYVRTRLETHLVERLNLDSLLAPLVAEWVLGGMAPEYLFADWPSELQPGTPGWVVGTQAVHFAEALIPGVTRKLTYQHLLGFSQSSKATPQLAALQATITVDPVVTWALMNEIITRDTKGNLSQQAVTLATEEYDKYIEKIVSAAAKLGQPIPHRKPLALKELTSAVPDCDPDEWLVKHIDSGGGAKRKVSVLDLYMGDELHDKKWDRLRGPSIYQSFPRLTELYPVTHLYEEAIDRHYRGLTEALANNIEVALSQLPPGDAPFIEYGALGIYCIQKYTTTRFPTLPTPGGIVRPLTALPGETGRFGILICAQMYSQIRCYELFPIRLKCRSNPKLEPLFRPLMTIDPKSFETEFVERQKFESIPIDVQAYLQNSTPRDNARSRLFIRKIGEFKASSDDADSSYPNPYFRSPRKEALSKLIAQENPYFTVDELKQIGLDQTQRERAIAKTDAIFNTLINLIIPFKECIEELSSGVDSRQRNAIFGCVMDVAAVALAFAVIPGKIAVISSKAATVLTRLLSSSRVLIGTTLSLFNPLDGLPQLLKGGGKLLGRSATKLSNHAFSATHLAREQLRHLTGAYSYDLLKAVEHTGSATQIRMSLDTVAHARAIFRSDGIESAEQILKHLYTNDAKLLKHIPEQELARLLENSLVDIALKSDPVKSLKEVMNPQVVDSLVRQQAKKYNLAQLHHFEDHTVLPEIFDTTLQLEYKNLTAMHTHQNAIVTKDLGQAPFNSIADELTFNPGGLTDNTDRATAWILNASSSRNELDTVKNLLLEYSANSKPLNDPTVYAELHRRIAPADPGGLRSPHGEARYPSNVSGAALLEKHVATLDPANEHFARQMLGAMLGYHSFVDGNGRTARAIYAIAELRKGRFNAISHTSENALSGLA